MKRVLVAVLLAGCGGGDDGPEPFGCPGDPLPQPDGLDPAIEARVDDLLAEMTLDEKLAQMSGSSLASDADGLWLTPGLDRLGIPPFQMVDGNRGAASDPSTCFPVGQARGAAFDRALERDIGEAIALEAAAHGANVLLAPTINVLRHPAWGRAQETYGEDPYELGELGVAFVEGAQQHAIATPKHFALNSIEDTRFDVSVEIEERPLREVYLPHFEKTVKQAHAGAFMSAYNRVNGTYAGEQPHLLREILKDEWQFPGFVMSDWVFGTRSGAPAVTAGLDIEMPSTLEFSELRGEVGRCEVTLAAIDDAVRRILRTKLAFGLDDPPVVDPGVIESAEHLALAQQAAEESIVLLRNESAALPIDPSGTGAIAVVGMLADLANLGDEGSSDVDPSYAVTALAGLRTRFGDPRIVSIPSDTLDDTTRAQVAAAEVAVVVVGLTAADEGENIPGRQVGDRDTLALSAAHQALIADVAASNPRTVVILEGGSALLTSPWSADVEALLMAWYPGQEGGTALARILAGDVSPSGRLPVSFPVADADLPPFDHTSLEVTYDLFHGYTYLDREDIAPAYAFGAGLGYGDVTYDTVDATRTGDTFEVTVTVSSVDRTGDEVLLLFVSPPAGAVERAERELRGFDRVSLTPGNSATVTFEVPVSELARWDETTNAWVVDPGTYTFTVGPLSATAS